MVAENGVAVNQTPKSGFPTTQLLFLQHGSGPYRKNGPEKTFPRANRKNVFVQPILPGCWFGVTEPSILCYELAPASIGKSQIAV